MFDAAEKSLEKCTQGCGGKRTEHEYKNSTYDSQTLWGEWFEHTVLLS